MAHFNRGGPGSKAGMDEIMESENNRMVENIASKVSRLKGIAIDIEKETKQQNAYLGGMGDDFGSTSGLLGGSVQRLSNMLAAGKSNRRMMCYLIAGLVFMFFVLYYGLGKIVR